MGRRWEVVRGSPLGPKCVTLTRWPRVIPWLLSEPRWPVPEAIESSRRMQKIAILYDASQAVLSTFDLDEVLRQILVIVRDEVVGVLDCQSENTDHFDNDKIDLLTLFSTQASMALQNARLYSLERQRAKQLEVINAIAQQTTAVLDQEELLVKVCALIQQAFQVGHVSVLLRDDEGLVLRASQGRFTACGSAGGRLPATTGLWGRALAEGKTFIENDVRTIHEYVGFYQETQSRMCIPLVSFGQTLGVLMLERDETGSFQEGDMKSLEAVADICATAIQNAH